MKTMRGFSRPIGGLVGLAMMGMAGTASAGLIGSEVTVTRIFNSNTIYTQTATVTDGLGPEFQETQVYSIDIEASTIRFDPLCCIGFTELNTIEITGLDWIDEPNGFITGLSLLASGFLGIGLNDFSFTDNTVTADADLWIWTPGVSFFVLTLETDHTAIPEPATLGIFAIGLAGLGFMTRRRRNGR